MTQNSVIDNIALFYTKEDIYKVTYKLIFGLTFFVSNI